MVFFIKRFFDSHNVVYDFTSKQTAAMKVVDIICKEFYIKVIYLFFTKVKKTKYIVLKKLN